MTVRAGQTIEWMKPVVPGWKTVRIKSLFADSADSISTSEMEGLEVDHFSIPAFDSTGNPAVEEGSSIDSNKKRLLGGELLFSKLNSHKPRVWLVPTGGERTKVSSTEFLTLVPWPSSEVSKQFFSYLLASKTLIEYITCYQTAVTNSHRRIKPRNLLQTHTILPPLTEQKRIAAYLDASCAAIDQAVETKQKQLDTLDTLRKSIITPAILSGLIPNRPFRKIDNPWLRQIPEGWKLVSLKRVSETQSGLTLGKNYDGPLVERPYLRAANVQDGYLDLEKITKIEIPERLTSRYELQDGDVLMTEGGDLDKLGRGYMWEGQIQGCLHQNHVFSLRTNHRYLLPEFLMYLTASQFGRDYFEATGKRTTNLASTNSTKVGLLPVPLPSVSEQREIVNRINQQLKQSKEIEMAITSQISTLTNYRKSLIHECVTGKRRITDADVAKVEARV